MPLSDGRVRWHHRLDFPPSDAVDHEDLRLALYTADPGSPSRTALDLLASWIASPDDARPLPGDHHAAER